MPASDSRYGWLGGWPLTAPSLSASTWRPATHALMTLHAQCGLTNRLEEGLRRRLHTPSKHSARLLRRDCLPRPVVFNLLLLQYKRDHWRSMAQ